MTIKQMDLNVYELNTLHSALAQTMNAIAARERRTKNELKKTSLDMEWARMNTALQAVKLAIREQVKKEYKPIKSR
jgi:hypothetical protein